jgi:hypothetical protein
MTAATGSALSLPPISAVDAADESLGSFKSELASMKLEAATFVSFVPLDDAHFLDQAGIEVQEPRRHIDPALIARLLVFADDILDDVEYIRKDALALRGSLLTAYREFVIEGRCWREEARDAS